MKATRLREQSVASITFALGALVGFWAGRPALEWLGVGIPLLILAFGLMRGVQAFVARRRGPSKLFELQADERGRELGLKRRWRWLTSSSELEAFAELCRTNMEDEHAYPTNASLRERLSANPYLIFGMFGAHGRRFGLDAAFVAYPLTDGALQKFLDGSWDNSRGLERRHIASSWHLAKGLYVAGLVARPGRSRMAVLEVMQSFIEQHHRLPVLARRGTSDGERIMLKTGMRPILNDDGVWILARP